MSALTTSRLRWTLLSLLAIVMLSTAGCSHDPAKTVTIEISGMPDNEQAEDAVDDQLQGLTDGSSHLMTSTQVGDVKTIRLSPVTDVQAFADKIQFGQVTEVKNRTVKVTYGG